MRIQTTFEYLITLAGVIVIASLAALVVFGIGGASEGEAKAFSALMKRLVP